MSMLNNSSSPEVPFLASLSKPFVKDDVVVTQGSAAANQNISSKQIATLCHNIVTKKHKMCESQINLFKHFCEHLTSNCDTLYKFSELVTNLDPSRP